MSSILKALKRLENDAGRDRRREPWPSVVAPESRAHRRTRRIFRWNVLLSGLMISAAVVGGLWLFFSRNPDRLARLFPGAGVRGPAAVAPAAPAREALPGASGARGERPSPPAPSEPVSSAPTRAPRGPEAAGAPAAASPSVPDPGPPPVTAPKAPAPRAAPLVPDASTPVLSSRRGEVPERPAPGPPARAVDPSIPDGPAAGGAVPPSAGEVPATPEGLPAEPAPAPQARPDRVAGIAEASDPRFHIQALVWSEIPSERMAVVNGQIVKTGGMVGEVRVTAIGNDYLIFQEGENRWKHRFRVK